MDNGVIVVGGGIGGMAAALALARTGLPVRLLERAAQFSEVGAGLQVGPNAVRVLDRLGLLEQIEALASFPRQAVIADAVSGDVLTRMDLQEPMAEQFGYPYLVLHRNDVLTILLDACRAEPGITLETGSTVAKVTDESSQIRLSLVDGREMVSALVVGADGLNSTIRSLIRVDEPVFSGYIAYRGTAPVTEIPQAQRSDDIRLWMGPGIHLMQYPVRGGQLYNQVAVFKSARFAAGREDWGTPDELDERFTIANETVRAAIPMLRTMRSYPNYDKEPLDTFVSGRAVLIGDAAHPMLQYLGQGACQALEDGFVLAALLGGSLADIPAALMEYDALRVARTTKCQRVARPWGESWHSEDVIQVAYRDRYFRSRASDNYSDVAWLYEDSLATVGRALKTKGNAA
jgi:2-polyprenyl-6-methoxyphenol hydroxylase-like FAD-dependent oxidoreductase